jgi:hypothetical protein
MILNEHSKELVRKIVKTIDVMIELDILKIKCENFILEKSNNIIDIVFTDGDGHITKTKRITLIEWKNIICKDEMISCLYCEYEINDLRLLDPENIELRKYVINAEYGIVRPPNIDEKINIISQYFFENYKLTTDVSLSSEIEVIILYFNSPKGKIYDFEFGISENDLVNYSTTDIIEKIKCEKNELEIIKQIIHDGE